MFPNQALQRSTDRPRPWFWIRVKTTLGCCLGRQSCAAGMAEAGLPVSKVMPASLACELLKLYCREGRRAVCVPGALLTLCLCVSNCQGRAPYSHSSGLKCCQALVVCDTGSEFEHWQVLESWRDQNFPGPSPECSSGHWDAMSNGPSWICHSWAWPVEFIFLSFPRNWNY